MSVTDPTGATLGTCLSTSGAMLNHSCNPNCIFIFSGASLAIRSLQPIPANGELTISYTDITVPSHRRQEELRSVYYFTCGCEYCTKKLTCGLPDIPPAMKNAIPSAKILNLGAEAERLQALAGDATPAEKVEVLDQTISLFASYKEVYPIWRHPWPSIRDEMRLLQWTLGHWSIATLHALKAYFFIDPILYSNAWHPIRIQRVFLLSKLVYELQYQMFASTDNNGDQVEGSLKEYNIHWLCVNKGLEQEIEAAIPKAFGIESSFAEEYRRIPKSESPEKYGMRMDWAGERAKLERAARELVD
ncbi:MAG: hypothetical protein Q9221_003694 [Calogaya cf. arnoldii]